MKSSTLQYRNRARALIAHNANISDLLDSDTKSLKTIEQEIEKLTKQKEELQRTVNELTMLRGDNLIELATILAKMVGDSLEDMYSNNPERFCSEDGTIDLQQEDLFAQETDALLDLFEYHDQTFSREYIRDYVWEKMDHSIFSNAEEQIRMVYRDSAAYQRDPYGYHGVSQADFLAG
ncbi:hypothetical protein [Brevibacillus borstelensis]|uniref:hypothetical protein n=1 Tax=Brevibacillus borstelensis TaxID=45462 RepID=UPI0004F325F0|nr:hypothetical protein [Brevibacillus borstelensis]KKX52543.1 hypothetical protein X546_24640 [Brevibacillus borstelensis cifa_chp40]